MIRLFRVFIPASVIALLISEILLVVACYILALYVLEIDPAFYLFDEGNYWKLITVTGLVILSLYLQDMYADLRIRSRILLVQQICLAVGVSLLVLSFLGYIQPEMLMGRWLMMLGSLAAIILLPLWRILFWRYVIAGFRSERVLLMGINFVDKETTAGQELVADSDPMWRAKPTEIAAIRMDALLAALELFAPAFRTGLQFLYNDKKGNVSNKSICWLSSEFYELTGEVHSAAARSHVRFLIEEQESGLGFEEMPMPRHSIAKSTSRNIPSEPTRAHDGL